MGVLDRRANARDDGALLVSRDDNVVFIFRNNDVLLYAAMTMSVSTFN